MTPAIVTQAERIVRAYQQRPAPIIEADWEEVHASNVGAVKAFVLFSVVAFVMFCACVGAVDVWHRVFG